MKNREIGVLCQFGDRELFCEVSTGLGHIMEVVRQLDRSARRLPGYGHLHTKSVHAHAGHVLGSVAEEEAAKVLILLDFIRCPRSLKEERSRQLRYFYDHLAKGIYAEYCSWRPVNFDEVTRHVNINHQAFYLDGPMDVDWIFYNDILSKREDRLYVNYVKGDNNYYWQRPHTTYSEMGYLPSAVIEIAAALEATGVMSSEGLALVAEIWRKVKVEPELTYDKLTELNLRTLTLLQEQGALKDAPDASYACVRDQWPFPLYPLDLSLDPPAWDRDAQKERIEELQKIQQSYSPESW